MSGDLIQCKITNAGSLNYDTIVLAPADYATSERLHKSHAKADHVYAVRYKRSRSPRFHSFVMAIIRDMFENQREDRVVYKDEEVFRAKIKLEAGWVYDTPIVDDSGVHWQVKPTDWTNCGEEEFREFLEKLKPVMVARLGEESLDRYRL